MLTLALPTEADKATDPKNYQLLVDGSTFMLRPDNIVFDRRLNTVTFQHLSLRPGDHLRITVLSLWDTNPDIPAQSVTCHLQIPKKHRWWG